MKGTKWVIMKNVAIPYKSGKYSYEVKMDKEIKNAVLKSRNPL